MGGGQRPKQPARVACSQANLAPRGQVGQTSLNCPPSSGSFPGSGSGSQAASGEGGTRQTWAPRASAQVPGNRPPSASSRVRGVTETGAPPQCAVASAPRQVTQTTSQAGGSAGKSHPGCDPNKTQLRPHRYGLQSQGRHAQVPTRIFFKVPKGEGRRTKMQ